MRKFGSLMIIILTSTLYANELVVKNLQIYHWVFFLSISLLLLLLVLRIFVNIKPLLYITLGSLFGSAFFVVLNTPKQINKPLDYAIKSMEQNRTILTPPTEAKSPKKVQKIGTRKEQKRWIKELKEFNQELANGLDINATLYHLKSTPFHKAVRHNQLYVVKKLLKMGAFIYQPNESRKETPFTLAIKSDNIELLKLFLLHNADPNYQYRRTPLPLQIVECELEKIEILLEHGANPNIFLPKTQTPIHKWYKSYCKDSKDYHQIIELMAKYSHQYRYPIFNAIGSKDNKKLDSILASKVDLEVRNEYNDTPLFTALVENNLYAIEELLKHGANPHHLNILASTPLLWISYNNRIEALKIFIKHNIDINYRARKLYTPLSMAITSFRSGDAIKLLLENGANPYIKDIIGRDSRTILIDSCKQSQYCDEHHSCYIEIMELLNKYNLKK